MAICEAIQGGTIGADRTIIEVKEGQGLGNEVE